MSKSIFNTDRQTRAPGQIASSEFALVKIGARTELGQSVNGTYTRQIQTIFELGSPNILWLAGHEQGTLTFNRLVGSRGFFSGWEGDACGEIKPVSIDLSSGPCAKVATGGLTFRNAMIESVNFAMQSGTLEISEGISMRVASMGRS